jgi:hypothetical protein
VRNLPLQASITEIEETVEITRIKEIEVTDIIRKNGQSEVTETESTVKIEAAVVEIERALRRDINLLLLQQQLLLR